MSKHEQLDRLFLKLSFTDFKWLDPKRIVVSQWVRMKCVFGCKGYGVRACCPPNVTTVSECQRFFHDYSKAIILGFEKKVGQYVQRVCFTH